MKFTIALSTILISFSVAATALNNPTTAHMTPKPNPILKFLADMGIGSAKFQLGSFYFDHSAYQQAILYFKSSQQSEYSVRECQNNIALSYFLSGKYTQSEKRYMQLAKTYNYPKYDFFVALCDFNLQRDQAALVWLNKAVSKGYRPAIQFKKEHSL